MKYSLKSTLKNNQQSDAGLIWICAVAFMLSCIIFSASLMREQQEKIECYPHSQDCLRVTVSGSTILLCVNEEAMKFYPAPTN